MKLIDRRFLNISLAVLGIANEPAANPTAGSQYIVGSAGTGAFSGVAPNSIARFNGSAWEFITPKLGELEVLNLQTLEILRFDGSSWDVIAALSAAPIPPVLAIIPTGDTLPASAVSGDVFLNISDAKIYTATDTDSWNDGILTADGDRYASLSDFKVYQSDGQALSVSTIHDGAIFFNKQNNSLFVFDAVSQSFVKAGASLEAFTEAHSITAAEAFAKSFSLTYSIASGQENNIICSVSGIMQIPNVDFSASGQSISWNGKGLDTIGLEEGDTFIIHYIKE